MNHIPEDIICHLLSYFSEIEQFKLLNVSKLFNRLIKTPFNLKRSISSYFIQPINMAELSVYKNKRFLPINKISSNITTTLNVADTRLYYIYATSCRTRHNVLTGKYKRKLLSNHFGRAGAIDFDDKKIISGSADSSINIYDTTTGHHTKIAKGHTLGVRTLTFDSQLLLTGSYDRGINVWDVNTLEPKDVLLGHTDAISKIVISKYNSNDVFSIGHDGILNKWDIKTGESTTRINVHEGWANALIQYDANTVITGGIDEKARIWDLREKKSVKDYELGFYVRDICRHQNSIYIAGRDILHFDFRNATCRSIKPTVDTNRILSLSSNQQYITAGFQSGIIKTFDVKNDKFIDSPLLGHTDMVMSVKSDDEKVVSGGADNKVCLWHFYDDKKLECKYSQELEIINHTDEFNKIANKKNYSRTNGIYHRPTQNFNVPVDWLEPVNELNTFITNYRVPRISGLSRSISENIPILKKQRVG